MLCKNTVQFDQLTQLELEIRLSDVTPFYSFHPSIKMLDVEFTLEDVRNSGWKRFNIIISFYCIYTCEKSSNAEASLIIAYVISNILWRHHR